jgi:hypothetical protein
MVASQHRPEDDLKEHDESDWFWAMRDGVELWVAGPHAYLKQEQRGTRNTLDAKTSSSARCQTDRKAHRINSANKFDITSIIDNKYLVGIEPHHMVCIARNGLLTWQSGKEKTRTP